MGARTQAAVGRMRTSENIAADAVIEDELVRGFVHESICRAGDAGVGKGELFEDVPGCVCHGLRLRFVRRSQFGSSPAPDPPIGL
jgi:hypothetical protein